MLRTTYEKRLIILKGGKNMELLYCIMDVLKEHTNEKKTLTRQEITDKIQNKYDDKITYKMVRTKLDSMIDHESTLPDEQRTIFYSTKYVNDQERHSDYYYKNAITDFEYKFLIDSILSSKIFNNQKAESLIKRIQALSGKGLSDITKYAKNNLIKQRYSLEQDVIKNIELILKAKQEKSFIQFQWNVYDVKNKKVELRKVEQRTIKPLKLVLNGGKYYCLARHLNSEKIYTYSVELMTEILLVPSIGDEIDERAFEQKFSRTEYALQHPFMFGGETRQYKIRVARKYISRVVEDFSYEIKIIAEADETVDIRISTSSKGMVYWLLKNYDIAELIDNKDEELERELAQAIEQLNKKYGK